MNDLEKYEKVEAKLINEANEGYLITDSGGCFISVVLVTDLVFALITCGEEVTCKFNNRKSNVKDIVDQMIEECGGCIVGEL